MKYELAQSKRKCVLRSEQNSALFILELCKYYHNSRTDFWAVSVRKPKNYLLRKTQDQLKLQAIAFYRPKKTYIFAINLKIVRIAKFFPCYQYPNLCNRPRISAIIRVFQYPASYLNTFCGTQYVLQCLFVHRNIK